MYSKINAQTCSLNTCSFHLFQNRCSNMYTVRNKGTMKVHFCSLRSKFLKCTLKGTIMFLWGTRKGTLWRMHWWRYKYVPFHLLVGKPKSAWQQSILKHYFTYKKNKILHWMCVSYIICMARDCLEHCPFSWIYASIWHTATDWALPCFYFHCTIKFNRGHPS